MGRGREKVEDPSQRARHAHITCPAGPGEILALVCGSQFGRPSVRTSRGEVNTRASARQTTVTPLRGRGRLPDPYIRAASSLCQTRKNVKIDSNPRSGINPRLTPHRVSARGSVNALAIHSTEHTCRRNMHRTRKAEASIGDIAVRKGIFVMRHG